jgi:hypothetical protein
MYQLILYYILSTGNATALTKSPLTTVKFQFINPTSIKSRFELNNRLQTLNAL